MNELAPESRRSGVRGECSSGAGPHRSTTAASGRELDYLGALAPAPGLSISNHGDPGRDAIRCLWQPGAGSFRLEAKRHRRTMALLDGAVSGGGRWVVLTFERIEERNA